MRFLRAVEICFEIILCACICISSNARVTQEDSVTTSSIHIIIRIESKTQVLKLLFSIQGLLLTEPHYKLVFTGVKKSKESNYPKKVMIEMIKK